MEIEVITTKRKLSKAIVNQMERVTFEDLVNIQYSVECVLGYMKLIDGRKILLQIGSEYKILPVRDWKANSISNIASAEGVSTRFNSEEDRDLFLKLYQRIYNIAMHIHIYL